MKSLWGLTIVLLYLAGPPKEGLLIPQKGKCPFKDGVMRKLTDHKGVVLGPGESTVDIGGQDSIVLSATDGDTTIYAYADIDWPLVHEGQRVLAGQPIAIARENRIEFYVSNYLGKIFRNPAAYVDCICELPKEKPEN